MYVCSLLIIPSNLGAQRRFGYNVQQIISQNDNLSGCGAHSQMRAVGIETERPTLHL